jgi:hypothetical protein
MGELVVILIGVGAAVAVVLVIALRLTPAERIRWFSAADAASPFAGFHGELAHVSFHDVLVTARSETADVSTSSVRSRDGRVEMTIVAAKPSLAADRLRRWADEHLEVLLIRPGIEQPATLHGPDREVVVLRRPATASNHWAASTTQVAIGRGAHPAGRGDAGPRAGSSTSRGEGIMSPIQTQLLAYIRWRERWRIQLAGSRVRQLSDSRAAAALADLAEFVRRLPGDDALLERLAALQSPLLEGLAPPPNAAQLFASYGIDDPEEPAAFLDRFATAWVDEELQADWKELDRE